jgi:hypothetical protein
MADESKLNHCLDRYSLHLAPTDALVRLAVFLGAPTYDSLREGLRRHHLVNAIQRCEKHLLHGRKHPYKKKE